MPDSDRAPRRFRIHHLAEAKQRGAKITMLTAYDAPTARLFDEAGVDVLLVGDSMGDVMLGLGSTLPVALEDVERACAAVAGAAKRALVVGDLPFGSYEDSPAHAFASAVRLVKAGAHAVKLEGGRRVAPQVAMLTAAGIPVIGHLGFTPQSVHALGGPRVQGKEPRAVASLLDDAHALQAAGASAVVLELMVRPAAAHVTRSLAIPTIGIGAGPDCDGQVLVWTDMAGLTPSPPRFAKAFGDVRGALLSAARAYTAQVRGGAYPDDSHSYS